jgi:hypothetical protein
MAAKSFSFSGRRDAMNPYPFPRSFLIVALLALAVLPAAARASIADAPGALDITFDPRT